VSRLEITTREEEAEVGTQLVVEAGRVLDVSEVGGAPGTEITVRSLFFNTPARFKFLKSDAAEAARISEMIRHLALAYPSVSFVLTHNGREQLRVEAQGEAYNALVAVLGGDTARHMLPIFTSQEFGSIQVTGFVGRPQLTRANRNGQLFFVTGRVIRSQNLQHAFRAAYEGLLHGRDRYPVGAVFLQVAESEVDVNVHPAKSEVRFVNEGEAHHALRVAVRDTLVGRS
jgi:DNA mismatch repair protein MutL